VADVAGDMMMVTVPDRNPDGELLVVTTTVLDPHDIPALNLAEAYQRHWRENPLSTNSRLTCADPAS
jgi:hypothetical protein